MTAGGWLHGSLLRQGATYLQQFGVEHRGTGSATDRVVAHSDELIVEHWADAEPTDTDRHPTVPVGIEPRLRPVLFIKIQHRSPGRAGEA